jgi:hypothetical protein
MELTKEQVEEGAQAAYKATALTLLGWISLPEKVREAYRGLCRAAAPHLQYASPAPVADLGDETLVKGMMDAYSEYMEECGFQGHPSVLPIALKAMSAALAVAVPVIAAQEMARCLQPPTHEEMERIQLDPRYDTARSYLTVIGDFLASRRTPPEKMVSEYEAIQDLLVTTAEAGAVDAAIINGRILKAYQRAIEHAKEQNGK